MARADASEMRNSGPVPPDEPLARAGDLHKHKHTRSKTGRWLLHRALLIPADARSKLRCDGEWMASVPIPKFASLRGTRVCELWNQRDTSNL